MVNAAFSRKLQLGHAAGRDRWQLIIPLVAAIALIGGGWMTVWAFSASKEAAPRMDELLETTKGLQVTQQQAVDQLQIVQDQLVAQQSETKKLSEQIATLTGRLDALQQSIANTQALSAPITLPKAKAK